MKLLLIGNPGVGHVGGHLHRAAKDLGLSVNFLDVTQAFASPSWEAKWNWWIRGHRPSRLHEFGQEALQVCREFKPKWLLSTGIAPLEAGTLQAIREMGVERLNFLTDDPWNPAHWAPWFMEGLPFYDRIFSPRRANLRDLEQLGCSKVSYLPFAYSPEIHFPEAPKTSQEQDRYACDVVFIGGADRDRLVPVAALIRAGFQVALYGGYWDRFRQTRAYARGQIDPTDSRRVVGSAKVALCLVRRANRDGHSMRSFEIPAMGGCMLTEDTQEHRELFGKEGESTLYFHTIPEMLEKLRWMLQHNLERQRLASACHQRIVQGRHTYKDRLVTMLGL
ncbi:MAG: glycosyltransferase [Candidatus Omnitrophica bacterium]|nr:glycosyltransferase [Candidatus Omnitrophota bacterium]